MDDHYDANLMVVRETMSGHITIFINYIITERCSFRSQAILGTLLTILNGLFVIT